jgi:ribosomal protein S1
LVFTCDVLQLFAAEKQPKVKKVRKEKPVRKEVNREEEWRSSLRLQGTLTYNVLLICRSLNCSNYFCVLQKMQEGMIILSCVKHISNLALQMEFPGLTFGLVTINNISDIFTEELAAKLQKEGEEVSRMVFRIVVKPQFLFFSLVLGQ